MLDKALVMNSAGAAGGGGGGGGGSLKDTCRHTLSPPLHHSQASANTTFLVCSPGGFKSGLLPSFTPEKSEEILR